MDITHVVRGSEYLSSAPKYNLLYEAFSWEVPAYVHLPLIVKPDGSKISKRKGDATFEDLLKDGYLVEAVLNCIALLGWSPDTNQEIFTLAELEKVFSIERISKSPSAFDMAKLRWFNAEYIRAMSPEAFHQAAMPWLTDTVKKGLPLPSISRILQPRTEVLSEIPGKIGFLNQLEDYSLDIYIHKKMKTTLENSLENLKAAMPTLEALPEWTAQSIHDSLMALITELGVKNGQMLWPIRTALSGWEVTPGGAMEIADILGKDESLRRIRIGIDRLTTAVGR
jgi:glutamyl-tRNA synthetase